MAKARSILQALQAVKKDPQKRGLILVDTQNQCVAYGTFTYGYDHPGSTDAVKQMFDASFSTLLNSDQEHYEAATLPVVQHVGQWGVTVVERDGSGNIVIRNGDATPLDHYIGLER